MNNKLVLCAVGDGPVQVLIQPRNTYNSFLIQANVIQWKNRLNDVFDLSKTFALPYNLLKAKNYSIAKLAINFI